MNKKNFVLVCFLAMLIMFSTSFEAFSKGWRIGFSPIRGSLEVPEGWSYDGDGMTCKFKTSDGNNEIIISRAEIKKGFPIEDIAKIIAESQGVRDPLIIKENDKKCSFNFIPDGKTLTNVSFEIEGEEVIIISVRGDSPEIKEIFDSIEKD